MRIVSSVIYGMVSWASRNGLVEAAAAGNRADAKVRARRTGVRGETFAYWYLRQHGYVMVARNYTIAGMKGEADLIGYDDETLAFIEVKTRSMGGNIAELPEDAVRENKRRNLIRLAGRFLSDSRVKGVPYRFDILAIETQPGRRPIVRLHKGAFSPRMN